MKVDRCVRPLSLFYSDASADVVEERSLSALSLARSAQAERDNESCFFVRTAGIHRFIRPGMGEVKRFPLMVCTKNATGEDVKLPIYIEPEDDFGTLLRKAKTLLGYDIDINSITQFRPASLQENVYEFLKNTETVVDDAERDIDSMLGPNDSAADGLLYILDDGTQIKSSQIQFDNEDPLVDVTAEEIPFVKYADENGDDRLDALPAGPQDTIYVNINGSPVSGVGCGSSKRSFVSTLPFKTVPNSGIDFVSQFSRYLEVKMNRVESDDRQRTLTDLNVGDSMTNVNDADHKEEKKKDQFSLTREEVLNMLKDSPLACAPYDDDQLDVNAKRRHVRKTDPTRPVYKKMDSNKIAPYVGADADSSNKQGHNCFICGKFIDKSVEKLYLFDREDQKIHKSSPQRRMLPQLKIICEECLDLNFKPRRMRSPNRSLDSDEFLVIRNNQQYVFKKIRDVGGSVRNPNTVSGGFVSTNDAKTIIEKIESEIMKQAVKDKDGKADFVKFEMGSDGEIIAKPLDGINSKDDTTNDVKIDRDNGSSDVEIVNSSQDNVLDDIDEADEQVKQFLGKYRVYIGDAEMKCRFCELPFDEIQEVISHAPRHRHDMEDGAVFPCPLCDYGNFIVTHTIGYSENKWLRAHLLAAHKVIEPEPSIDQQKQTREAKRSATAPDRK
ncbi:hypothetical protein EVAR_50110_1 [Eumeta japonica]|uniref:C2H2-type domain-containing protein n=1 Tax=Eumeta variegata TaxID=151549 RepID=A0A4C1XS71_EUMVA|nr:hypothetical protein EVAR_50110_1 [Eumeta japonica]